MASLEELENTVSINQEKNRLLRTVLEYAEAVTGNDPAAVLSAPDVRVTCNGSLSEIGKSPIWGSPRRIPYRQTFVDPETRSAVFFGIITNTTTVHAGFGEEWWLYAVRLKTNGEAVTEVEEIINANTFAHYETKPWEMRPNAVFGQVLPEDERLGSEDLKAVVEAYWNAVERSVDGHQVPFHPDAVRRECGTVTTDAKNFPNSARGDFINVSNVGWRWDVANRRYPVVDVTRGVVVSFADLRMSGGTNPDFLPCIVAEAFKIENGLIKALDAFFYPGTGDSNW